MKSIIRKNILRGCSVAMAACLVAGVAVAATGKSESGLPVEAVSPSRLTDVTGKYDTSELRKQYFSKENVSLNTVHNDDEYWFLVDLDGESLMEEYNRSKKYDSFSSYLSSREGQNRQNELLYAQRKVLATLDRQGISYEKKYSYTELNTGLALKLKLKDVPAVEKVSGVKAVYVSESYAVPQVAVSNNANVYSTGIYNTDEAPNHGAGMVVAVLDTGLDYTHAAFQTMPDPSTLAITKEDIAQKWGEQGDKTVELEAYKRQVELNGGKDVTAEDVWYNDKIPYAYDYADDDADVYPTYSTHGTHVAGIVAGKDDNTKVSEDSDETFVGVVPDAQLVICKVFSDNLEIDALGGANAVDILAAVTDCVKLGVDVINMSLGTSAGFSDETGVMAGDYEIAKIYELAQQAGVSLVVAASNDYSSGFGGSYGTNLASNPDSGTVGSPSTYPYALSVASINGVPANYFIANEKEGVSEDEQDVIFLTESNDANGNKYGFMDGLYRQAGLILKNGDGSIVYDKDGKPTPDKSQTFKARYVVIGGVGTASDYTRSIRDELAKPNTLALIKRGDTNFADKVQLAMRYGAAGCIIYNNVSGTIRMSLGEVKDPIPTCSIGMDEGNILVKGAKNGIGTLTFSYDYSAGPFMSDFSSWGPTPSLELKPEITAHGGEITSSVPGGYETLSGTSMAAPNMSGAIAILRSYVASTYHLEGVALTNRVYQLLMSTATMARNEENNPYSPRKQGAGLAGINEAVKTKAYLTVSDDENNELDKPKLELGDDKKRTGVYEMEFDVHNVSSDVKSYTPDVYVMTETLSSDLKTVAEKAYMLENCTIEVWVDGVKLAEGAPVSVAANATAKVKVKITLDQGAKDYLNATFKNGMYVEGFVRLVDTDTADGVDLGIPYLAFYGDWNDAPLFDWSIYEVEESEADRTVEEADKKKASASPSRPLGLFDDGQYILNLGSYLYQFAPTDKEIIPTEEHAAISCYDEQSRQTIYQLYLVYAGLLRGAKKLDIDITDTATGEVLYTKEAINARKSYAAGGSNIGSAVYFNLNPAEWSMPNNRHYTVTMKGHLDYEGETKNNDSYSFGFTVDIEAPVITDYRIRYEAYEENEETKYRIYLDTDVYDNQYAMSLLPCYIGTNADGQQAITLLSEFPLPIYSSKGGITTVSYEVTDIFDTYVKTGRLLLCAQDYALNETIYAVNPIEGTDYPSSLELETDEKLTYSNQQNQGHPVYDLTLAQYECYKLNIKTSPESASPASLALEGQSGIYCEGTEIFTDLSSGSGRVYVSDGNRKVLAEIRVKMVPGNGQKPVIEQITFEPVIDAKKAVVTIDNGVTLNPNTTTKFVPKVLPWYTAHVYDLDYVWSCESNRATVDANGNVTTLGSGTAWVDVQVKDIPYTKKSVRITIENELDIQNNILLHYYGGEEYVIPDNLNIRTIYEEAFQYNKTIRKLTLPISVTTIPEDCFLGCENLEEIVIPAECTIIMMNAFRGCEKLKKITLVEDVDKFTGEKMTGVLTVARSAFEGCTSLDTIVNSKRITALFNRAFAGCTSLETIDLSELRVIGTSVFEGCASLKNVIMSEKTSVGEAMFRGCTSLETLAYTASEIPAYAFYGCTSLKTITFPGNRVSEIGAYAFYNTGFVNFTLPNGTYGIGERAFANCANLQTVQLGDDTHVVVNGASPFVGSAKFAAFTAGNASHKVSDGLLLNAAGDTVLAVPYGKVFPENYTVPNGITAIGTGAFTGTKIKSVDLNGVTSIGKYAFSESSLSSIDLSGLSDIPEGAFYRCSELRVRTEGQNVVSPVTGLDNIKTVGDYAFANCTYLRQRFDLPAATEIGAHAFDSSPIWFLTGANIQKIGAYAFYGTNLDTTVNNEPVRLESVTTLGDYAFARVRNGFKEIVLGAVTDMGECVFADNSVERVVFGVGTTRIGNRAFVHTNAVGNQEANTTLRSVTVPSTVKEIGAYAFCGASNLSGNGIDLSNVHTVGGSAFYECTLIKSLDLRDVETVEPYAFAKSGLTAAALDNATVIGNFAFANAPLTSLSFPKVIRIYPNAFFNTQLVTVEIPETLNTLTFEEHWERENDFGDPEEVKGMMMPSYGAGSFGSIATLKSITVAGNNPVYFAEDGVLYARTERGQYILLQYPRGKEGSEYRVKDNTVRIAESAFYNVNFGMTRNALTKIVFPYTLKEIGTAAFYNCSATEYVFESVEAPILESQLDYTVGNNNYPALGHNYLTYAYFQGMFYSNFFSYVAYIAGWEAQNQAEFDNLTITRPANGRGYDNYIWNIYFYNVKLSEYALDDASHAFIEQVNALKTVAELKADIDRLSTDEAKLAALKEYSEQSVLPVRQSYNAIVLADQLSLLTEHYNVLLALEKYLRDARGDLGDTVEIVDVTASYPDKYRYYVGETFDETGIVVRAIYEDGSIVTLARDEYTISGYNTPLTLRDNKVVVTYKNYPPFELLIQVVERPPEPVNPPKPDEEEPKGGCGSQTVASALAITVALGAVLGTLTVLKRKEK